MYFQIVPSQMFQRFNLHFQITQKPKHRPPSKNQDLKLHIWELNERRTQAKWSYQISGRKQFCNK